MKWSDLQKRGFKTMVPEAPTSYVLTGNADNTVHANIQAESGTREINVRRGPKNSPIWTVIVLNATDDVVGIGHGTNHDDARTAAHR